MDNAHLKKTWEKGIKALEQRDFARAIVSLKKVEKAAPQGPDVHFAMADAFLGQGKVDQAIRQCRQGVDVAPNAIAGWIRLGRLFLMTGKGEQALKAFSQADNVISFDEVFGQLPLLGNQRADKFRPAQKTC